MNQLTIAEVKTATPFEPEWRQKLSWDKLLDLASYIGDIVSIHTDERWDGSFDLVRRARRRLGEHKLILAKGLHEDDDEVLQALEASADLVLRVGEPPDPVLQPYCLLEPYSLAQLAKYPAGSMVVWNSRDIETGFPKEETFDQARLVWPQPRLLIQASYISTQYDIHPRADGIIVGTDLPDYAAVQALFAAYSPVAY